MGVIKDNLKYLTIKSVDLYSQMSSVYEWSKTTAGIQNGSGGLTLFPADFRRLPLSDAILFRITVWWPLDATNYHGLAKVQNEVCYVYYDDGEMRKYRLSELIERKVLFTRTILNTPEETPLRRGFSIPQSCSLCLSPQLECPSRVVSCKHMFCGPCLQRSLWTSQSCPLCRGDIDECQLMSYTDTLKWRSVQQKIQHSVRGEKQYLLLLSQQRKEAENIHADEESEIETQMSEIETQMKILFDRRRQIKNLRLLACNEIDRQRKSSEKAGQKTRELLKLDLLFRELVLKF